MKKSFMTRVLATGLSLAMAFSLTAATNVSVASAATKPAMKSSKMTVNVGQSKNYQATAATQKAYKITKIKMSEAGKTKAEVKINSSKKSIKVTGLAATKGSNVVISFKNNTTKKTTTVTTKVVVKAKAKPVETVEKITEVKQKTFTEFEATMSKALEKVSAADFAMVRDNDNQVITVKSATLDATDKTKVKLVVYTSLTDAKTYTVTYTAADEAKTKSEAKITVTDGTVAAVNITPVEITANVETLIEYQTLDANGVIVSQKGVTKPETKVDVTWDSVLGTMDNLTSKYILYNVGDAAKFTVTYHTYKYDGTTGAEVGAISQDFTVTAVKDATTITQYAYTATKVKPYNWAGITENHAIAVDDLDGEQRTAYFLIKDAKGNVVTNTCEYTVESSDNSIVVADGDVTGTMLTPVNKGSAFLMIKDKDGKVVHTLPITVGDKRRISTFKLSSPVVNVATRAAYTAVGDTDNDNATCVYTDVTAKDQYGENIPVTLTVDDTKSTSNYSTIDCSLTTFTDSIQVTGKAGNDAAGTDTYVIKATDALGNVMPTTLRVNAVAQKGAVTYSVVFLDQTKNDKVVTSVDTTLSENKNAPIATGVKDLHAVIVAKQNGVVLSAVTGVGITSLTVKKNDGTVVASVSSKAGIAKAVSGKAITDTEIDDVTKSAITFGYQVPLHVSEDTGAAVVNPVLKNLGVGTYQVYFELEKTNASGKIIYDKAVANFSVTDKQTPVTAKVAATEFGNIGGGDIKDALENTDFVKFYYGDQYIVVQDITAAKVAFTNGKKNVYVTNVTATVEIAETGKYMSVVVPIGKTFTTTNSQWSNP